MTLHKVVFFKSTTLCFNSSNGRARQFTAAQEIDYISPITSIYTSSTVAIHSEQWINNLMLLCSKFSNTNFNFGRKPDVLGGYGALLRGLPKLIQCDFPVFHYIRYFNYLRHIAISKPEEIHCNDKTSLIPRSIYSELQKN